MRLDLRSCPVCDGEADMTTSGKREAPCEIFCRSCGIKLLSNELGLDCGHAWNALRRPKKEIIDELTYRRTECAKLTFQMGRAWTAVYAMSAAFVFIGGALVMNIVLNWPRK